MKGDSGGDGGSPGGDVPPRSPASLDLIPPWERRASKLPEVSDAQLRELAEGLSDTLRQVAEDEKLWAELRDDTEVEFTPWALQQLALLDWETLLSELGVEDAEAAALELVDAVSGGTREPEVWDRVRERLYELADRLHTDAQEPPPAEDRRRWGGVRRRVGAGISVLRRVRLGVLAKRSVLAVSDVGGPALLGALVFGAPLGAVAIAAAVIWGVGRAALGELGHALAESAESPADSPLAHLFDDPTLSVGVGARLRSVLKGIEMELGGGIAVDRIAAALADLRAWAAHVGVRLASVRPLVGLHLGPPGQAELEGLTFSLIELQRALRGIAAAVSSGLVEGVRRAVADARDNLDRVSALLLDFRYRLANSGLGRHA